MSAIDERALVKASYTNNPTLSWCTELERVKVAEAVARGINVAGLEKEPYLILVTDSKNPGGPPLVFTGHEVAAFILGVKGGEFDHLIDRAHFAEVLSAQPA
jgi:hypothetical protein